MERTSIVRIAEGTWVAIKTVLPVIRREGESPGEVDSFVQLAPPF